MARTDGARGMSREDLRLRATVIRRIRAFFEARDVLDVDTPALSVAGTPDLALASMTTRVAALAGASHYLHTSPEYAMKRLLAAGSGDIFQLCRVFRDGELGRWHEPEFTLLEWYRVGFDEHALMDEVFALVADVLGDRLPALKMERLSYAEAFDRHLGIDPHRHDAKTVQSLAAKLGSRGIDAPTNLGHDELLDLALGTVIGPSLAADAATFVYDYPASQAALAEIKTTHPPVAARFELFVAGLEIGNGFRELTDAREQRRRFETDLASRRAAGRPTPPLDEAFLAALESGLPPCAGVAIGVDRLIAIAAGATSLAEVVPFAHGGVVGD